MVVIFHSTVSNITISIITVYGLSCRYSYLVVKFSNRMAVVVTFMIYYCLRCHAVQQTVESAAAALGGLIGIYLQKKSGKPSI